MSPKRWAAATAAGIVLVICMPVSALATETDECADAGLISSLLGQCGLLGGLLGGSDPVNQDPDAVDSTAPDDDEPAGTDDSAGTSGGPSSDTSGGSTGSDDSGGTSGQVSGSSSDPPSTGSGSHGVPAGGAAGTSDETSVTGTRPVGPSSARISDSGAAGAAGRARSGESVEPSQRVGPFSELPDAPPLVGQVEELTEAAGIPRVAESTGPVVGVALTLITAGIFVAATALWTAIWRNAGRADA
ncbi:MAG TPA: hypothetical protein VFZ72_15905 [Jiangellaceae bacterium]